MRKRQKLVLTTLIMTVGMAVIHSSPLEWKYPMILIMAVLNYVLASWSLKEGLSGIEWLTVLIPPVLFTIAVGVFYVLLPQSIVLRVLIILTYAIVQYALLLTANIFSVAAIRTIALFRAGMAVAFVIGLLTGFLLFDTILSFRQPFWVNMLLITPASFLIIFPNLWSVKLENKLSKQVLLYSLVLSILVGVLGGAIGFWPVTVLSGSTFLCTALYVFIGLVQHYFQGRLFSKTVTEYVVVGLAVLFTMLITSGGL